MNANFDFKNGIQENETNPPAVITGGLQQTSISPYEKVTTPIPPKPAKNKQINPPQPFEDDQRKCILYD